MSKVQEAKEQAQRLVETAIKEVTDQVLVLLQREDPETRAAVMNAINWKYHSCGSLKEQGYCTRCQR